MPARLGRPLIPLLLVVGLAWLATQGPAHAASTTTCKLSAGAMRSFGPTYVEGIQVTGTSCATGRRVVRAFHKCRTDDGGEKGYCHKKVLGYACKEKRQTIRAQFSGTVTCKKGHATVLHVYSELT